MLSMLCITYPSFSGSVIVVATAAVPPLTLALDFLAGVAEVDESAGRFALAY